MPQPGYRPLLPEYQLSNRSCRTHLMHTRWLGIVAIVVTLLLMFGSPTSPAAGLWCALGLAVGLEMILWGLYEINYTSDRKTIIGMWLLKRSEKVFPVVLYLMQHAFTVILLLVLWFTLGQLGFPTGVGRSTCFVMILTLFPLRRLFLELVETESEEAKNLPAEFAGYLNLCLIVTLLVSLLTAYLLPQGLTTAEKIPEPLLVMWVPTILTMLVCLVLFVDDVGKERKRKAKLRSAPQESSL